jgi:hypothetical protein
MPLLGPLDNVQCSCISRTESGVTEGLVGIDSTAVASARNARHREAFLSSTGGSTMAPSSLVGADAKG